MIRLTSKFTTEWDGRCWVLTETYQGKDKKGNDKDQQRESYHGTLRQVCKKVVEAATVDCVDVGNVIEALDQAGWLLEGQAEGWMK